MVVLYDYFIKVLNEEIWRVVINEIVIVINILGILDGKKLMIMSMIIFKSNMIWEVLGSIDINCGCLNVLVIVMFRIKVIIGGIWRKVFVYWFCVVFIFNKMIFLFCVFVNILFLFIYV